MGGAVFFLPDEGNLRRSDFDDSKQLSVNTENQNQSMTCVSKQYEIKTKMEQEQCLQLKMLFLLGYNLETVV